MNDPGWIIELGSGPFVAAAIHDGHQLRDEVADKISLDELARLREEDPFTGRLTDICQNRIVVKKSRFEVDLNRPRERTVYLRPEDAWGLELWKSEPDESLLEKSLAIYDTFYADVYKLLKSIEETYGRFIVLDLHSYCHRRGGAASEPEPQELNPDINVGTGTLNKDLWGGAAERFICELRRFDVMGCRLDVRENVKFKGGYFSQWIHENFPETGCCLAVEFKKIFMDEWTGKLDENVFAELKSAMSAALKVLAVSG